MNTRAQVWLVTALLAVGVTCVASAAERGPSRRPDGAASRIAQGIQKADQYIRLFDANRDGVIEPTEVHGRSRYVYERMSKEAGLDPSHSISVSEFRVALARHLQRVEEGGKSTPGGSSAAAKSPSSDAKNGKGSDKDAAPRVVGLGGPVEATPVAGMGQAANGGATGSDSRSKTPSRASASPGAGSSSSSPSQKRELDEKIRRYAASLLKRYDRNKNGVLEKDEWKHMRGSPEKADRNQDGVITVDELGTRLAEYGRDKSSPSSSTTSSVSSSRDSSRSSRDHRHQRSDSSGSSDERKSYRFLTPTERLPNGLPDWFARKDADADGQVSMAEYSSSWSDATAAEFVRFDRNNDGVVTPSECLEAEDDE